MNMKEKVEQYVSRQNLEFLYSLLGRLQADCDYYLGYGFRNENKLWGGTVEIHLLHMEVIFNSFAEEEKPRWITKENIEYYKINMIENELG